MEGRRAGGYFVFEELTRGGMSTLYLGRRLGASGFSRIVVLKKVHPALLDPTAERMLLEEARLSSRVRSVHVVPTIDVIKHEGELVLVMELLEAVSLRKLLHQARESGREVPLPVATAIVADILRGLHAAHEAVGEDGAPLHLIHRDMSPKNILVGADGIGRVIDFGIAKALQTPQLTAAGQVKGTLGYMAPEQLRGAALTRAADLYAVGLILWELVTLRPARSTLPVPGRGFAPEELLVPPPSSLRRDAAPLDELVGRALALEPAMRFQNADAMLEALVAATPPGSHDAVASFVERHAFEELDLLRERARACEALPIEDDSPSSQREVAAAARPALSPPARRSGWRAARWGAAVASLVVLAAVLAAVRRRPEPVATAARGLPSPTTSVSMGESMPDESVPASEIAPAGGAGPAAAPAPRSRIRRRTPTRSCHPPYTLGPDGYKHFKPECVE